MPSRDSSCWTQDAYTQYATQLHNDYTQYASDAMLTYPATTKLNLSARD